MFDWALINEWVHSQLATNEFLSGGIVVVVLTTILNYAKNVPFKIWNHLDTLLHTTLTIYNTDYRQYSNMLQWLGNDPKIMSRNRSIVANDDEPGLFGFGRSWFFYKYRLIKAARSRQEDGHTGSIAVRESVRLRMWGRSQDTLKEIVNDSNALAEIMDEKDYVNVYSSSLDGWSYSGEMRKRPLESVILKQGQMESLVGRIKSFRDCQDECNKLGVPDRLGIMLEGPPGTGKTSTIRSLASKFDACLYIINMSSTTDAQLARLCGGNSMSSRKLKFIVFEDADCIFDGRKSEKGGNKLTFSGLLNALDGLASGERRVLFMTTNHVEKLDPALIRPGRIDLTFKIDLLDAEQTERMYNRFFDDGCSDEFTARFVGKSAAEAQEHLVKRYFGTEQEVETLNFRPTIPMSNFIRA